MNTKENRTSKGQKKQRSATITGRDITEQFPCIVWYLFPSLNCLSSLPHNRFQYGLQVPASLKSNVLRSPTRQYLQSWIFYRVFNFHFQFSLPAKDRNLNSYETTNLIKTTTQLTTRIKTNQTHDSRIWTFNLLEHTGHVMHHQFNP